MRIIAIVMLCCFMLAGCAVEDNKETEAIPQETAAVVSPAPEVQQLTAEGDLDGDGIEDRAEIIWEGPFACPFDVKVSFGTGDVQSITISDETVDSSAKMYIDDITGDAKAEIILPNIGGTDTKGTVSCLLISYEGDKLIREDVYGKNFFKRDSSTYTVEMDESYSFKLKSIPTGKEYHLPRIDLTGIIPSKEVFFDTYTVNGYITGPCAGKKGITAVSWLEYGIYDDSGEKLIKAWPQHIYSTLRMENGKWKVVNERVAEVNWAFVQPGSDEYQQPVMYTTNPYKDKTTLEEINAAAGTDIQRPLAFEVSNEEFLVIDTEIPVADYRFSIGENNYTLRASKSVEDISGVYGDMGALTHWFIDDVQYSLFCESGDDYQLRMIAAEQAPVFYPVVEEIGEGFMTVAPNEETPERASSDKITVPLQHVHPAKEPVVGDVVEISYNGVILESYPAQLGEVYRIQVMLPVG